MSDPSKHSSGSSKPSRRASSVMSVDSDEITPWAAGSTNGASEHADGDDPFQFPSVPHTPMRSSGNSAGRQRQWNSSVKKADAVGSAGGNPNKRMRLSISASDNAEQASARSGDGGSATGRTLSLSQLSFSRPRVAFVPDCSTMTAPQQERPAKRQEATESAPAAAVPFIELTRAAFDFAAKQAKARTKTQLRAFDSVLSFCNSYQRPKPPKPLPLPLHLSSSSTASTSSADTKPVPRTTSFLAPPPLPYLPIHTTLPHSLELAKDDPILRCFPDPTLVPATTDLGASHYSQQYSHPLTDHYLLTHTRSGLVDVLAAAVMHALAYLVDPQRDPCGSYRGNLAYKLERAFETLLWSPEQTRRVSRLFHVHEMMGRVVGACLMKGESVEVAEVLMCAVWYTVAKRVLRQSPNPSLPAGFSAAAAGMAVWTPKMKQAAMQVFLDNYCPDCQLFGCSHVHPLFKSHRPPRLATGPTPETWNLSLPYQPCSPDCWTLVPSPTAHFPRFEVGTSAAIVQSLNLGLPPCTVALIHETACCDIYTLAQMEIEPEVVPDSGPALQPASATARSNHPSPSLDAQQTASSQRRSDSRRKGTPQRRPPTTSPPVLPDLAAAHRSPTRAKSARASLAPAPSAGASSSSSTGPSTITVDYGSLPLAFPCDCIGLCDADCECRTGGHFCDQVCQCPATCVNRWQGCDCVCDSHKERDGDEDKDEDECCRLKRECACVRAGRECGRMCKCRGGKWGVEAGCVNRVIGAKLVDPDKYTYVDLSLVPDGGWGLFTLRPLPRSFPLGEYTGEVITDAEADRRGLVYDEMKLNYFFDLANDAVVDAFRLGNALRFINHGSGKAANVQPKVVIVNGSQRILLRTKRAVGAGQELVMDYGPKYQLWKGAQS